MSAEVVQVDARTVQVALGKFRASLAQKSELMKEIGASMLLSIYRTFREEGSPAGIWPRLAPSTEKSYGARAAGHKLLFMSGRLRNSILAASDENTATIGTNLIYAAVHQFGSRDRGSIAIGPRTSEMHGAAINVRQHGFARLSAKLGQGKIGNRSFNVRGPRNQIRGQVSAHTRHQNIPARPYLVFRPEDPQRIRGLVNGFIARARAQAGLGAA